MTQTDPTSNVEQKPTYQEELQVMGEQLLTKVKELLHEGNVRRIIIKQEGHTIVELPLTVGLVGAFMAPALAAMRGSICSQRSRYTWRDRDSRIRVPVLAFSGGFCESIVSRNP